MMFGIQYFSACHHICEGMKTVKGTNDFYLIVTLRSFIEYHRRGIWFLAWATDQQVHDALKLNFDKPGSPGLVGMDKKINAALGLGQKSPLTAHVVGLPGTPQQFVNGLHALTHGNPIAVRMLNHGMEKTFNIAKIYERVDMERDIFAVILARRVLGHDFPTIWKALRPIHNTPAEMKKVAGYFFPLALPHIKKFKNV
jgi:hypothetical protein